MADQTTGPRMLTSEEISEVCGTCRANSAIETWIKRAIRRYCHVNQLPMPVEDAPGVSVFDAKDKGTKPSEADE